MGGAAVDGMSSCLETLGGGIQVIADASHGDKGSQCSHDDDHSMRSSTRCSSPELIIESPAAGVETSEGGDAHCGKLQELVYLTGACVDICEKNEVCNDQLQDAVYLMRALVDAPEKDESGHQRLQPVIELLDVCVKSRTD